LGQPFKIGTMNSYPLYPGQVEWLLRLYVDSHNAFLANRPVDQALSSTFRKNKQLGSKDRKFYSTAIFGLCRYWGWLSGVSVENPLLALYYAYLFEGKIPALWWSESLGQTPIDLPLEGLENKLKFWKSHQSDASLGQLNPAFVPEFLPETLEALSQRPPAWVRLYKEGGVLKKFRDGRIKAKQHKQMRDAWELSEGFNNTGFRGEAEVQDLASQAVARVCAPKTNEDWLDYCAGAGGKGLHLGQILAGSGSLTLTDTRAGALEKAHLRALEADLNDFKYLVIEEGSDPLVGLTFDGVLADVPCSGSGTWARAPWLRWQLNIQELLALEQLQKEILDKAAQKVRPGGVLVYATCSLIESENQGVVGSFLRANPNFALEPFVDPISGESTPGELAILPQDAKCNGMYICKMRALG